MNAAQQQHNFMCYSRAAFIYTKKTFYIILEIGKIRFHCWENIRTVVEANHLTSSNQQDLEQIYK